MIAVILNSGKGSRMGSLTQNCHKSMLTLYNGETIFGRQLRLLEACGIHDFIVTTGPFHEQLEEEAAKQWHKDIHVTFVENPQYETTNYIYSLYLARKYLQDDIILLHGDLVFSQSCIEAFLSSKSFCMGMVHANKPLPEKDFKARTSMQRILEVSTNIFDSDCCAFQPFYKFDFTSFSMWMDRIEYYINNGITNVYAENALNELLGSISLQAFDYSPYYIDEIDDENDYIRVVEEIQAYDHCSQIEYIGRGTIERITEILACEHIKQPYLVCGVHVSENCKVIDKLQQAGYKTTQFSCFSSNPLYQDVIKGVSLFKEKKCDCIISVGGGSCLDVAKCIKLFCSQNDNTDYLEQNYSFSGIKHIAVPTTAGTGSEATRFAVIYWKDEKQSIQHDCILPDYVILDANLLRTLPMDQRKSAYLDAICHCIESIWSIRATDESRTYAIDGLSCLLNNAEQYLSLDSAAEDAILYAANLAGKAINISQTTAAHAMCYKLTTLFHIPHGFAAALCLPAVWRFLSDKPQAVTALTMLRRVFCVNSNAEAIERFEVILHQMFITSIKCDRTKETIRQLCLSINPTRMKNMPVIPTSEDCAEMYAATFQLIR